MSNQVLKHEQDDEFEKLRQQQETKNEIVINFLQIWHFLIVLMGNIATRLIPIAPYRASAQLLIVFSISLALRIGLYVYFKTDPPYHWWRKYLIFAADLAIFTAAALLLGWQHAYPWLFLSLFTVCIYTMLVVLGGLRYDERALWFGGLASIIVFSAVFPWRVESAFQLPILGVGVATLLFVTVVTSFASSSLQRLHREAVTKEQLSRFLAPELVSQILARPELLSRKTELRRATVMFTDIRGFTAMSEHFSAEIVVQSLNEFLEEMTDAIMQYNGMVDKYIGDAVLGVFGVPLHIEDHAQRAVQAAVEMCRRIDRLNLRLRERGLPDLSIGVGIHTGELLIGVIGSSKRFDYTVIGDTVNVASRIEALTGEYKSRILVSNETKVSLTGALPLQFVGNVSLRNRTKPLDIWSPDEAI